MRFTKEIFLRAVDAGIDAFIKQVNKEIETYEQMQLPDIPTKDEEKSRQVIAYYIGEFRKRYGAKARPDLGGKALGAAKRLLKDYTVEQVCALVFHYLKSDDQKFSGFGHDLTTLDINRQKVLLLATGNNTRPLTNVEKFMTQTGQAKQTQRELPAGL